MSDRNEQGARQGAPSPDLDRLTVYRTVGGALEALHRGVMTASLMAMQHALDPGGHRPQGYGAGVVVSRNIVSVVHDAAAELCEATQRTAGKGVVRLSVHSDKRSDGNYHVFVSFLHEDLA